MLCNNIARVHVIVGKCYCADYSDHREHSSVLYSNCVAVLTCHMCLQGPREDTGFTSSVDPGILLAKQLYDYVKTYHPESQIMASGLRTKEGE